MKRRINARPKKYSLDEEIAQLRDFDLKGLQARWRSAFRKVAPPHLPPHLLFGILAYRLQVDEHGDLEPTTARALAQSGGTQSREQIAGRLTRLDRRQNNAEPGTVLMREWKGCQHRVMVMADGYSWNGKTYKSLSAVAFAMTGTKWNGPRFFGLRELDQ